MQFRSSWRGTFIAVTLFVGAPWAVGSMVTPPSQDDATVALPQASAADEQPSLDLSLDPPPVQPIAIPDASDQLAISTLPDQALIPLPPGAHTGLTGLAGLSILGSFSKTLKRFINR